MKRPTGGLLAKIRKRKLQEDSGRTAMVRAKKVRDRAREKAAELMQQTCDGLSPNKRAALVAAQKRASEDPRAQAMLNKAEVERRVRDTRKLHGIGETVPPVMMGEPIPQDQIPMSVAQRRAAKAKGVDKP